MSIPEPAAKRSTLVFTAGLLWAIIGVYLFGKGMILLMPLNDISYMLIGIGIFLGILKSRLIFKRIIDKNLERIKQLSPQKEKICLFAFQAVQSYFIAGFMIGLGIMLRHLPIEPHYYGAILIIIGTTLFTSSLLYFSARQEL